LLLWTTGPLHALSAGISGTAGVQVARGQGFGPKLQLGGGGAVDLSIPFTDWIGMRTSLELFGVLPSDASGGFLYRGFGGGAFALMLEAHAEVAAGSFGELRVGGGIGAAVALPGYQYTTLYFFFPEARTEALLLYRPALPAWLRGLELKLTIPLRAQFRRDLDFSISTGIGISAAWQLGASK
jgi:hypothetical protein